MIRTIRDAKNRGRGGLLALCFKFLRGYSEADMYMILGQ